MATNPSVLKIETHSLGLAGLALAPVFGVLSQRNCTPSMPSWWSAAVIELAIMALLGGVSIAYQQVLAQQKPRAEFEAASAKKTEKTVDMPPLMAEGPMPPTHAGSRATSNGGVPAGGNIQGNTIIIGGPQPTSAVGSAPRRQP